jgi:hypothetical protein
MSNAQAAPPSRAPIVKQDGVTDAERRLSLLCSRTFLSLWSYPSVFRDQGKVSPGGDGKEVCDLLVVFGNDIIIFSDKDCSFPSTGKLDLDWSRWFRKAVLKSAEQLWGAERWIREHPSRLFLDRKCTQPLPLALPDIKDARFHRIVVAHAAAARCRELLGGSGSLVILPCLRGRMHFEGPIQLEGAKDIAPSDLLPYVKGSAGYEGKVMPFVIGDIGPSGGYVHVLDDTSLDVLMETLDTASDLVEYLTKKEAYVRSGWLAMAAGEDELLAHYLQRTDAHGRHDFHVPAAGEAKVIIPVGEWDALIHSPEWKRREDANEVSYFWDAIIERCNRQIMDGKPRTALETSIAIQEQAVRALAQENRFHRRLLSLMFGELRQKRQPQAIAARVVGPLRPDGPHYVFLTLAHHGIDGEERYRKLRLAIAMSYGLAVKSRFPDAMGVVIVAGDPASADDVWSQDVLYRNLSNVTPQELEEGRRIQQEHGYLAKLGTPMHVDTREFPQDAFEAHNAIKRHTQGISMKPGKRQSIRNSLCPCGSNKKAKKCCLRL